MKDPYKTLKVNRSASIEEIRQAWAKLVQKYHPDKNPGDAPAEARFKEIQAAWELLRDPQRRERFDRTGDTTEPRDSQVASLLCTILDGVLQDALRGGVDVCRVDLVKQMREQLDAKRAHLANTVCDLRRICRDLEQILGRFVQVNAEEPAGGNVLDGYVRGRLEMQQARLKKAEEDLGLMERAITYLKQFGYKVDTRQGPAVATITSLGLEHLQIIIDRRGDY